MKALRTNICTYAIALLASIGFATSTFAGSSDFSGIWIAGHAELNVVAIDGSATTGQGTTVAGTGGSDDTETAQGTIGGFAPTAGYEIGFNVPLGDTFFVTVGFADGGGESAAIAKVDDGSPLSTTDVSLHASNPQWWYIAPSISIFDNSAVYVKLGRAEASLTAIGDVTGAPGDISGDMYGIGTTTIAAMACFLKQKPEQFNTINSKLVELVVNQT